MRTPLSRIAYAAVVLLVAGYALGTLRGPRGIPALFEKRQQIQTLEERNQTLTREIERTREHVRRLASDPARQELEIRERLKLISPGDKVFIINDGE
jgi:cell division protein FtsB